MFRKTSSFYKQTCKHWRPPAASIQINARLWKQIRRVLVHGLSKSKIRMSSGTTQDLKYVASYTTRVRVRFQMWCTRGSRQLRGISNALKLWALTFNWVPASVLQMTSSVLCIQNLCFVLIQRPVGLPFFWPSREGQRPWLISKMATSFYYYRMRQQFRNKYGTKASLHLKSEDQKLRRRTWQTTNPAAMNRLPRPF